MADIPPTNGDKIRLIAGIKERPKELMAEIADGASHDPRGDARRDTLYKSLEDGAIDATIAQKFLRKAEKNREEGIIPAGVTPQGVANVAISKLHDDLDTTSITLIDTVADSHGKLNGQLAELVGNRLSRKELDALVDQYAKGQKEIEDSRHTFWFDDKAGIADGQRLEQEALRKLMPVVEQGVEASIENVRPDTHKVALPPVKTV